MNKHNNPSSARTPMTPAAASRIQGATARAGNGTVARGSFAARAQTAAAGKPTKGK